MQLTSDQLTALGGLSTSELADAIEAFQVRLRNVGFTNGAMRCSFDDLPPVVGYAATARIRTSTPPMVGAEYGDRIGWWKSVQATPGPRIVVLEDVDPQPGIGALVGRVHAHVLRTLGVVGLVTNGAVRDLPQLRAVELQCFARHVVPSHAYAHVFEFDVPVRVGGLEVAPGDLLHGDRNGLVKVPAAIAPHLPAAAARLRRHNAAIVSFCQSSDFNLERLHDLLVSRETSTAPTPADRQDQ